jgi:hypothetical protein
MSSLHCHLQRISGTFTLSRITQHTVVSSTNILLLRTFNSARPGRARRGKLKICAFTTTIYVQIWISTDIYVIKNYLADHCANSARPAHLLVLPFVPHPSSTAISLQPPHYFCTAAAQRGVGANSRVSTPSYSDPPPDYETLQPAYINHGAQLQEGHTPCSCCTQMTNIQDEYGKYIKDINSERVKKKLAYGRPFQMKWPPITSFF